MVRGCMVTYRKESKRTYEVKRRRGRPKPSTSLRRIAPRAPISEVYGHLPKSELELWLKDSDDSLKVAKDNMTLGHYHIAAFCIHMSVEKALKAAIISLKHKAPPKTHRLRLLYSEVADEIQLTDEQVFFLGELTPVARRARYVDAGPGLPSEIYTKEILDEYLEKALPIIEAIKAHITEERR